MFQFLLTASEDVQKRQNEIILERKKGQLASTFGADKCKYQYEDDEEQEPQQYCSGSGSESSSENFSVSEDFSSSEDVSSSGENLSFLGEDVFFPVKNCSSSGSYLSSSEEDFSFKLDRVRRHVSNSTRTVDGPVTEFQRFEPSSHTNHLNQRYLSCH